MEHKQNKRLAVNLLIVAGEILLIGILFIARKHTVQSMHPFLLCLCDGTCAAGLLYLLLSVILWAHAKGALDGVSYIFRTFARLFASERALRGRERYISFYDYVNSIEHKPGYASVFALVGAAAFAVSVVLYLIYRTL